MTALIRITRAGPMATIQDAGRFGALHHGISASGPMDRGAFERAGAALGNAGAQGIEFTQAGLSFTVVEGHFRAGGEGGEFSLSINGSPREWPAELGLGAGDAVDITPGPAGNYGYLRFDHAIDVPVVVGSWATNLVAGL
ncbi:MAG: hypothetical protein ABI377_03350, partial [Devosia sp.]